MLEGVLPKHLHISPRETDSFQHQGWASEGQPIQTEQNCSLYSVSPALAYQLEGTINQAPTSLLLDTGAAVTLLRHDYWSQVGNSKLKPWAGG